MNRRSFIQKSLFLISAINLNPANIFSTLSLEYDDFEKIWDEFIASPTPQNSKRAYDTISMYDSYEREKKLRVGNKIDNDLMKLEEYVLSDNRGAVKVTYKLRSISDGAISEYLSIILGQYIHTNPTNFLLELKEHFHLVALPSLVGNYGPNFVDEFELQNNETQKRIDSLQTVTIRKVQKLKKKCIDQLKTNFIPQESIDRLNNNPIV